MCWAIHARKLLGRLVQAASANGPINFISILFFALLGGLILNLMPCVLPVLSIKALGTGAGRCQRRESTSARPWHLVHCRSYRSHLRP